ncbi:hypothetical protein J6590_069903 [Homalodisca vitripennis]|nr:hypothetical protein J6590_069903 [Homalodisca vitripennis]
MTSGFPGIPDTHQTASSVSSEPSKQRLAYGGLLFYEMRTFQDRKPTSTSGRKEYGNFISVGVKGRKVSDCCDRAVVVAVTQDLVLLIASSRHIP